jgi:hypothetical protein
MAHVQTFVSNSHLILILLQAQTLDFYHTPPHIHQTPTETNQPGTLSYLEETTIASPVAKKTRYKILIITSCT